MSDFQVMQDKKGIQYSTAELFCRVGLCDLKEANQEPYSFFA